MAIIALLAAAEITDLGPGWAGAGLLGLVLAWLLLVHLPSKDKQIKDQIDAIRQVFAECQQRLDKKSADYATIMKEKEESFLASLKEITGEIRNLSKVLVNVCKFRPPPYDRHERDREVDG